MREMKDSLQQWIGRIPSTWKLSTINTLYSLRNEKVSDRDYPPLSVTMKGIVPQLETAAKTDAHDDRKLVKKGDFAINSRSDRRGSCGISEYDGSVSLINTILKPRGEMNPRYYNWVFHSSQFADEFYRWGHGIVDDLWTTRWQEMRNIVVAVPTLSEQKAIADALEESVNKVDALIANEEKQIEKLKEYKQSLITEVVTKGLDPKVPMKDSGVEWIGDIPANWDVTNIGRLCFVTKLAGFEYTKYMFGNIFDKGDVPIVRAQNIKMAKFIPNTQEFISLQLSEKLNRCALDKKCVVITFIGAGIGEVAVYAGNQRSHLAPNVAKIVINESMHKYLNEEFLVAFLMSFAGQEEINKIKKATAQPSLSMQTIRAINITIPTLEEQKMIVKYLEARCKNMDKLIDIKQQKIEKLIAYKKSLIYEYVTGKKEVSFDA